MKGKHTNSLVPWEAHPPAPDLDDGEMAALS
jgi:hypothetical protein